jgi:hypothetical protein
LTEALLPFGLQEIAAVEAELAAMLSGFRANRQQGEDGEAMVEVTRRVLREFPAWAISRACLLIATNQAEVDGKRLDRRFAPNDTEIHAVVSAVVKMRREALASAQALLGAPVASKPEPAGPRLIQHDWHVFDWHKFTRIGDGKHAQRVAADLAARKARRETTEEICDNG